MTVEELLPENYRDKASDYEKGTDTMDVWFDSGKLQFPDSLSFNWLWHTVKHRHVANSLLLKQKIYNFCFLL